MLDQLLREPENPLKEHTIVFETQALREAREILDKVRELGEPLTELNLTYKLAPSP